MDEDYAENTETHDQLMAMRQDLERRLMENHIEHKTIQLEMNINKAKINLVEHLCGELNPLENFLKSDRVVLSKHLYCREKVFISAFQDYCQRNSHIFSKWTNQYYAGTFSDFGVKVLKNCRKRYPNVIGEPSYTATWIIGVDIKDYDMSD